ncbi:P-loop containing nucleoside triphosphate hydrolase protein [Mycena crocata]|nr:P-loop containing nucleoside triphosphate hydrolase protein [Mycena crocata]
MPPDSTGTPSAWADTLLLPMYVGVGSFITLLAHILWQSRLCFKLRAFFLKTPPVEAADSDACSGYSIADHVATHGGSTILKLNVARLMGCVLLLCLSAAAVASDGGENPETRSVMAIIEPRRYIHAAMCGLYFYTACLAILSIMAGRKWSQIAIRHLNAVLLFTFIVYFYRDVFPLATAALVPMDLWEEYLLWPKVVTLFAVSGIIPLVIPRQYIPVDLKKSMPVVNPEQTSSILSSALYSFLNPIIFLAYRIPHLSFEQLPPLCDYDCAENLKTRAFLHLDPFTSGKKQHVFFGFLWIFRWEGLARAVLLAIAGLSSLISPIAIKKLLTHLEDPDADAFMKPWFWISLLFLGPLTYNIAFQWDMFITTRVMNQVSALLMQLVFEHALRIRVKAEMGGKGGESGPQTSSKKTSANLRGKINTMLTVDRNNISEACNVLVVIVLVPIQVMGSIVFLYKVLDWSAFVGMGTMVALFPLPGYVANMLSTVQKQVLEGTDARVQIVSETMNVLRMIKMFGWEQQMQHKIEEKRKAELNWIWWEKMVFAANALLRYISKFVLLRLILMSDTVIMKQELSAAIVFSSMTVFDMLRGQLGFISLCVAKATKGKVSMDRLTDFLQNTELLDSFDTSAADEPGSELIGIRDASFTWTNDDQRGGTITPSSRKFMLKIKGEVIFRPGFNLVVGPTGAGKTSLLMALLGEMHMIPSSPTSWFNLPRGGGVSYAAQESWVFNDTIKNNILFNTPMNMERYKKVLYQCGLEQDLTLFDAGDETEVGEKGLTLSGGQKARVTLARAIYADTQVILLDDILAALDVHTAKWVLNNCLTGDLIKNRTVVLVTHNLSITSKIADFVVSVGLDGCVHTRRSISDALVKDEVLTAEVGKDQAIVEKAGPEIPVVDKPQKTDGKLTVAEEIEFGHVSWGALKMFFFAHTVGNVALFFVILAIVVLLSSVSSRVETWYLGYWASQYGHGTPVAVFKYSAGFSLLVLGNMLVNTIGYIYFTMGSFNASKAIHTQFIHSVLGATFRWLDVTPTSRIIARCTADTDAIDDSLSESFWDVIETTVQMSTRFLSVVLFAPLFFIPGAFVGVMGGWCGQIYMASQLSVKREMSNARSPVLGHIGATISGLVSVRAYGAQDSSIQISMERIDRLTRASRTFANLNRWVSIRTSLLGGLFTALLAYYLVYFESHRPSNVGFTLTMAMGFSQGILNWVQQFNRFEVQSNSLERIKQYIEIEREPEAKPDGIPPAYWPSSGSLSVEKLSARYSPDGQKVLHDISFEIKSGERIGIVGRTGSGKSSLMLALLRCIFTEGTVYYDGLSTSSLNLDALRSNVTIIPQVPELLSGTLRTNLEMLAQVDDAALENALRTAGLAALQDEMEDGKLTLDTEIAAGGANLSLGQRQIIALARAIVRRSKILILDEATSAIDYKTDVNIQTSLRNELTSDTTCLIVAHRLHSVMDADRIMVLDAGRILEFDSPKVLLRNKSGSLRALVEESEDKEVLYKMADA